MVAVRLTIEFYTVVILLTFILIIISIPSPPQPLLFHPSLKTFFSANPSHRSLRFSSSGLTPPIPRTV